MSDTGTRRIVVKVGTSTLTGEDGRIDRDYLRSLGGQVAALRAAGDRVIVVSSGAIAAGVEAMGMPERPRDISGLQAAAAIGQVRIIGQYAEAFGEADVPVAQVLLTRHDTAHRQQYLFACATLDRLLEMDVVPIVNENDTTAVDEIRFGDNDTLAALVGIMVKADLVMLLTDIEGLYDADPRTTQDAALVEHVDTLTDGIAAAAGGAGSEAGSGGMATKVEAARILMKAGIPMVVADGRRGNVVVAAAAGEPVGTYFAGGESSVAGRKLWIAFGGRPAGIVTVDDGARDALCLRGKSLLPAGVVGVTGTFGIDDAIAVADAHGKVIARGLTSLSSEQLMRVKGLKSSEIGEIELELAGTEVVHRDRLVIL